MGFAYNQVEGTFALTQAGELAKNLLQRDESVPKKVQESLNP